MCETAGWVIHVEYGKNMSVMLLSTGRYRAYRGGSPVRGALVSVAMQGGC
jgi:hypothetical protein